MSDVPLADTPLHHIYASPAEGKGGRSFELGGWRWRPDGAGKVDPRTLAYRMAFAWNMAEGIPTKALEAGAIRQFYDATFELLDAVDAGAPLEELRKLAAKVWEANDAHEMDPLPQARDRVLATTREP